jgi:hypothetical protein
MADSREFVLAFTSARELLQSLHPLNGTVPRELRSDLYQVFIDYAAAYRFKGAHERMNGRRVSDILAEAPPRREIIREGRVGETTFVLYGPRPQDALPEAYEPGVNNETDPTITARAESRTDHVVFVCSNHDEIGNLANALKPLLPRDTFLALGKIVIRHLAKYGSEETYKRLNGRLVSDIIANSPPPPPSR